MELEKVSHEIQRNLDNVKSASNKAAVYFDLGRYYAIAGQVEKAFPAYSCAIYYSTGADEIRQAIDSLHESKRESGSDKEIKCSDRYLKIALAGKFGDAESLEEMRDRAIKGKRPLDKYVMILAGYSNHGTDGQVQKYREILVDAFKDFFGTIISGGTRSGVGKLAGDIVSEYPKNIYAIGYVPDKLPKGTSLDERYSEIKSVPSPEFNHVQTLQYWTDILAAGIKPSAVKLIGLGGNDISIFEYLIALALGASVVVLAAFEKNVRGRSIDPLYSIISTASTLPGDKYILRAYVGTGLPAFPDPVKEIVAKALHETYRSMKSRYGTEQSMAEWDNLSQEYKESNYAAVAHVVQKLGEIGYRLEYMPGQSIIVVNFNLDEIEKISEMEHARWMAERLIAGWKYGEKKDIDKKLDPSLKTWNLLDDETKELDRAVVRKLPQFFSHYDLQVVEKLSGHNQK